MCFRDELEQELVGQLPLREAIVVHPQTSVQATAQEMQDHAVGCAVIVDHGGVPTGFFTEQSLLKVLTERDSWNEAQVGHFADPSFICVTLSEPIARVWDAIQLAAARYVCVTDDDGELVGLTGQRGVAEYLADCFAQQVVVQRLGSKPWMQAREGA